MKMKFNCTGCGECCKRIPQALATIESYIEFYGYDPQDLEFPYSHDEKGVCEMLGEDNKCKVYENRPLVCNLEKFSEYRKINKPHYYKANAEACNQMIKEAGLPNSFLIKNPIIYEY
jgi:Fe-S-cluster containining protein